MARLPQKVWQALRVAARACTMRWGWCGHKELTRTPGLHRRCTELCTRRAAGVLRRGCSLARRTTILRLNTIVLPSGASGLSMRLFASGGAGAAGCALEQMYRSRFEPCDHRARVRSFAYCRACAQSYIDGTLTRCTIARCTTTHPHIAIHVMLRTSELAHSRCSCVCECVICRASRRRSSRAHTGSIAPIDRSIARHSTLDAPIARRSTNRTTLNQSHETLNQSATNQVSQAMRAMPHPIGAAQRSHARGL